MIGSHALAEYGTRDGLAVILFTDGRELRLLPQWQGDRVKQIVSAMLFEQNELVAIADSEGFWTAGDVTQNVLGQYCGFAIKLERQVYRFYRQKKMDEETWQQKFRTFWKIAMKCQGLVMALQSASLPVIHEKPGQEWL